MKQKTSKQGESKSRNKSLVTSFFEEKFEQKFTQSFNKYHLSLLKTKISKFFHQSTSIK